MAHAYYQAFMNNPLLIGTFVVHPPRSYLPKTIKKLVAVNVLVFYMWISFVGLRTESFPGLVICFAFRFWF